MKIADLDSIGFVSKSVKAAANRTATGTEAGQKQAPDGKEGWEF